MTGRFYVLFIVAFAFYIVVEKRFGFKHRAVDHSSVVINVFGKWLSALLFAVEGFGSFVFIFFVLGVDYKFLKRGECYKIDRIEHKSRYEAGGNYYKNSYKKADRQSEGKYCKTNKKGDEQHKGNEKIP